MPQFGQRLDALKNLQAAAIRGLRLGTLAADFECLAEGAVGRPLFEPEAALLGQLDRSTGSLDGRLHLTVCEMRQSPGDREIRTREWRDPDSGFAPLERSGDDLPRLVAPAELQVREAQPRRGEEDHALLFNFPREWQAFLGHPNRVTPASGVEVGLGLHGAASSELGVVELGRHRPDRAAWSSDSVNRPARAAQQRPP